MSEPVSEGNGDTPKTHEVFSGVNVPGSGIESAVDPDTGMGVTVVRSGANLPRVKIRVREGNEVSDTENDGKLCLAGEELVVEGTLALHLFQYGHVDILGRVDEAGNLDV